MARLLRSAALAVLAGLTLAAAAWAATPAQNLQTLSKHIDASLQQMQAGNVAGAQAEFKAFNDGWFDIEDGIRAQDRTLYKQIEDRMVDVQVAFSTRPPDSGTIQAALKAQQTTSKDFIQRYGAHNASAPAPTASSAAAPAEPAPIQQLATSPAAVQSPGGQAAPMTAAAPGTAADVSTGMAVEVRHLGTAQARIAANDPAGAAVEMKAFIVGWGGVEGPVATKAPDTYSATENKMAQAYALLTSKPPDTVQAAKLIGDIKTGLLPFAQAPVRYTIFDAAIILLREGFEALLVVAALLAFLKKSGNEAKRGWIWSGSAAGLGLSVVIAVVVNVAFAAAAGSSRELLEGVTGLVAAGMLIWMMFWLHSKANISAWNRYVSQSAGRALATNSLISLASIAFLAVLREGAETVLFYVGIAPAISSRDLFAGLAAGATALALVAVLMLVVGVRIPIRPFFLATSALIFFLAFKFVGFGVHSLQVSGRVTAHTAGIPAIGFLGIFPTWETTVMQLALLCGVAAALVLTRHKAEPSADREQPGAMATEAGGI